MSGPLARRVSAEPLPPFELHTTAGECYAKVAEKCGLKNKAVKSKHVRKTSWFSPRSGFALEPIGLVFMSSVFQDSGAGPDGAPIAGAETGRWHRF